MWFLLFAACAPKAPPAVAPSAGEAEHPLLLWRVERNGKASHLLGTCHLGVSLDYALPAPHDAALDHATVVFTEAEIDFSDPGRVLRLLWSEGPGLSERLAPETWRAVAASVREGFPASILEHMEPWAVASALPFLAKGTEAAGPAGPGGKGVGEAMDLTVQKRAKKRKIPIEHVETLEEQAAMLRQWNDSFVEQLAAGTAPGGGDAEGSQAVSDLCYRADLRGADAVTQPGDPIADALLRARNRAWVPRLLPALDAGGAFVAVGAGHMLGDDGLVDLLEDQGFTVTQLTTTRPPTDAQMPDVGGAVPAAPPAPADAAAREARVVKQFSSGLCDDRSMLRTCFAPDAAACETRIATDAALCARQWSDRLPADGAPLDRTVERNLLACTSSGLIFDALAHDRVGDGAMCGVLEGAIRAAGGG